MRSIRRRGGPGVTVLVALMLNVWGGIAAAQTTNDTTYPTVSTTPTTDPCTTPGVCGTVSNVGGARASSLPFTGGDVALLTVLGIAAVGSGVAIVLFSRRRSTAVRG